VRGPAPADSPRTEQGSGARVTVAGQTQAPSTLQGGIACRVPSRPVWMSALPQRPARCRPRHPAALSSRGSRRLGLHHGRSRARRKSCNRFFRPGNRLYTPCPRRAASSPVARFLLAGPSPPARTGPSDTPATTSLQTATEAPLSGRYRRAVPDALSVPVPVEWAAKPASLLTSVSAELALPALQAVDERLAVAGELQPQVRAVA
jgi:hypothetical protein